LSGEIGRPGRPKAVGQNATHPLRYRQRRDGGPELVIRRKYPVVAMPVLPRRRGEIGEPVEKLKRREFDDAIGCRPRGLPAAAVPEDVRDSENSWARRGRGV